MKNNPRPGTWMLLGGGVVLLISSFLKWREFGTEKYAGTNVDLNGFLGFWCLLIGAGIAVLVALMTFGNVNLPPRVLGFSWNQLFLTFGVAAFLITFGLQFADQAAIGVTLGWIASAVIVAGAFMEIQAETKSSGLPPTSF